jgi:biopolymer transport protein ExbB/TolQ
MKYIFIEASITILVVCLQIMFYRSTLKKIIELKNFFSDGTFDEKSIELREIDNQIIETIAENDSAYNDNFSSVIVTINRYLIKNKGTVDFSIIKSIVERNIESQENSIASNISLPLYTGLMGTFIGVVLGLWKIAFSGGVIDKNINSFIGGVVIAMIASFVGLLLTVINNSLNYKVSKELCDKRKDHFFNFLQVDLLPYLENSLVDTLDRLKNNISDFNNKFEKNIQLFDNKFTDNINSLKISVESLSENIGVVVENTATQKQFLLELKRIGYDRMAEANVKVFTLLKETGPTFITFIEKQKELTNAVEHAAQFVSTIESILNRVKTFEESINRLGDNIDAKEYLGNEVLNRIDKNLKYLDDQFDLLRRHSQETTADLSDFFKIEKEKIAILSKKIQNYVSEAFDVKIENNPLQKLLLLEPMDNHLSLIKDKLNSNGEFRQLCNDLTSTKDDIQELKQKLIITIDENKKFNKNIEDKRQVKVTKEEKDKKVQKSKASFLNRIGIYFRNRS